MILCNGVDFLFHYVSEAMRKNVMTGAHMTPNKGSINRK